MNKEQQFLDDLKILNLPFIELFQNHEKLRTVLFDQYLDTIPKPDFLLYLSQYFTDEVLDKGFREAQDKIPVKNVAMAELLLETDFEKEFQRRSNEFYFLSAKKKIGPEFYKHSIRDTDIMKKLFEVSKIFEDFEFFVTNKEKYKAKKYARDFTKNLITTLESIGYPFLTELILKDFIQNQESIENSFDFLINRTVNENDAKMRFRELRMHINNILNDYLESPEPQKINVDNEIKKLRAKHFVLSYLIECYAKGEGLPIGNKKELERIGNERIGPGKGNTFYKNFNVISNSYDLNKEADLIAIGGQNWRSIVKTLSREHELIETYLQSKQL